MKKKISAVGSLSIMSVFLLMMGTGAVTPALSSIAAAFPSISITTIYLVSTLPSLLVIPATLVSGALAGNKAKYKTLSAIGVLLFILAGVAPAFTNNFTVILIERAVLGIGVGLIAPLGNALLINLYEGNKRASMLGIGTVVMNLGGVVLQFFGGVMASINWNYSFYSHALGILSLIMIIFFLPEPATVEQDKNTEKTKVKVRGSVWLTSILFGIAMLLIFPVAMTMSGFLAANGLGGATVAGMVLSFFTIGGMIGGMIFGTLFKLVKKYIIAFGLLLATIGYALVIFPMNLVFVTIGTCAIGAGMSIIMPAVFMIIGMICEPHEVVISTSIVASSLNIFMFLSTYWIGLIGSTTGDMVVMPLKVNMIGLAIGAVIFLIINPLPKPKDSMQIA